MNVINATKNNRYSTDMQKHVKIRQPFVQQPEIVKYPEGWETGLSSDEFLLEAKKMLKKKFDDRN